VTHFERLSALDASFLHLESEATPMHVGALAVFDGAPFLDDSGRFRLAGVRRLVESRLERIPRFRMRLMTVPGELGRPVWVDDERFDITYHVRLTSLASPGTHAQLLDLTGRIEAQRLDRSRPLWELWFVEGLADGRVGLVHKTHHALVDGVSGVDVATVLLDLEPVTTLPPAADWTPRPAPSAARLLADTLVERGTEPSELVRSVRGAVRAPQRAADRAGRIGGALRSLFEGSPLAPRTSLNGTVGPRRRFVGVRIRLDDFAAVRRSWGGTLNDVVLTAVAGSLRRRLTARREAVPDHLRALCPVSVRDDSQRMTLGNRVAAMVVDLPLGEDPRERLAAIGATTAELKARDQAAGTAAILDLADYAAPTLLAVAARLVHRQPFVNLVVTNVPGPPVPLYCLGAEMLEAYPMVPLARNLSLGIAVLTYHGFLHMGLLADAEQWPDLDRLGADLEDEIAAMGDAAIPREEGAVG
jgi:WS/DGAT/MGAT family acyltransferase